MPINFDTELLLITAASGKQGSAILPHVATKWKRLRLQCISDASAQRLKQQYPTAEVVQTKFFDLEDARKLIEGVSVCYLNPPGLHPLGEQAGINMVQAAAENARTGSPFKHMVFSSVIHPQLTRLMNHDSKRFTEEAVIQSRLPFTIIQPTHFMDNIPIHQLASQANPMFQAVFNPETKISLLGIYDLGEAVHQILTQREKHLYATYEFVSTPEPLHYNEVMESISRVIGKSIRVEKLSLETALDGFAGTVTKGAAAEDAKWMRSACEKMLVHYDRNIGGLVGSSNHLAFVLGRQPLGVVEWATLQLM